MKLWSLETVYLNKLTLSNIFRTPCITYLEVMTTFTCEALYERNVLCASEELTSLPGLEDVQAMKLYA